MKTRRYYHNLIEAENERKIGERIYYKPAQGYYIIKPKRYKSICDFI